MDQPTPHAEVAEHRATPFLRAEPILFVTEIPAALASWARLGSTELFGTGTPPFYAAVARDGADLNLRHVDRMPRGFIASAPRRATIANGLSPPTASNSPKGRPRRHRGAPSQRRRRGSRAHPRVPRSP